MSGDSERDAAYAEPPNSIRLVQVSGQCPHCDVKKHQIDSTVERATQVVSNALDRHIAEAHHDAAASTTPPKVSAP